MSDACGCGHDQPADGDEVEHEPERLWQVAELRAAALAGVLLLAGYVVGWTHGSRPLELVMVSTALAVGAWT
ncbi:MAG: heavy metal translocating P-type ATPase, partial [Mycobacterium sp.]